MGWGEGNKRAFTALVFLRAHGPLHPPRPSASLMLLYPPLFSHHISLTHTLSLSLSSLSLSLLSLSLSYPSPSRLPTPLSLPLPPSLFLSGSLSLPLSQLFSIFVHMNLGTLLALGFPDTRDSSRRS